MRLVLSVDGGGIRGILPARLLQAIQESHPGIAWDLIAGTSTGGIICCGLCTGVPAKAMVDLYTQHGGEVFHANFAGGGLSPKYSAANLESLLQQILGAKMLSEASPELLIPSYCIQLPAPADTDHDGIPEGAASWFFKSWEARQDKQHNDLPLWKVARCTSAAPTYFPPASFSGHWMVDGGVFANNPSDAAWASASRLWPNEQIKVLSIGTGAKVTALDGSRATGWGALQWAPEISAVFMDGAADKTSYVMQTLLDKFFMRCETPLVGVSDAFDDASPLNITNLSALADKFVADNLQRVIEFVS